MTSLVVQGQKKSGGPIYVEGPQIKVDVRHLKWSDFEGIQPRRTVLTRGDDTPSRWIDRIGNMPDYLIDFYQLYGTTVQEVMDGQENWLSNPEKAEVDPYSGAYYVTVKTIKGSTDFTFSAGSSNAVIQEAAGNAVQEKCGNIMNEYTCFMNYLTLCMNYDYPEAFWTGNAANWSSGWEYGYNYSSSAGTGTANYTLTLTFTLKGGDFDYRIPEFRDPTTLSSAVTEFKTKVNSITESYKSKTRYEQVSGLNDWLTMHNSYNSDLLQTGNAADIAWSSMSALRESTGALGPVCEGYARAFKCLCDKLSIPCILANGNAKSSKSGTGEAHMWNEVQMENNNWYAVDVTWNDPIMAGADNNQKVSGGESDFWLLLGQNDEVAPGFTFAESHPNTPAGKNPYQSQWELLFASLITDTHYEPSGSPVEVIVFADANVKAICVEEWDTNGDGELSYDEAAAVTDLGNAFYNKRISTFNELQYFTGLKAIGTTAFHFSDITSVKLPTSVTEIGVGAFDETSIESIDGGITKYDFVIPNHITTLRFEAFACNGGIYSVTIPASVTLIEPMVFRSCSDLKSFSVDKENPVYKMVDGWLIENGTTLHSSPVQQESEKLIVPEGIKEIARYAASSYSIKGLKEVVLPSTIKKIGVSAFGSLEKITCNATEPAELVIEGSEEMYWYPFDKETFEVATLYVPAGSKGKYEAADGWKKFKNIVEMGETASITIGKSGKASYCGDKSLDFSFSEEIKAYIATGFDKDEEIIWLTRVKDVPAGVPVLIKGVAEKTYQVPVTDTQNSYYRNMFKGNTTGEKIQIQESDGDLVNYYLSGDGTFKSVKGYANIGNNKSYLQLPGTFAPTEAGTTQTVTIKSSGKGSYAAPVDLDFTNVEGLKAFSATGYDKSTKTIWLTRVMKVQKGEGVLLKGDAKDYEIPSVAVQSSYMNMFVGNTSGASVQVQETSADGTQTNFYLKGDGTFVSVNGYVNIGNNKCYLELPTSMVAGGASTRGTEANYLLEEPEMIKLPISFRSLENDGNGTTAIRETKQSRDDGAYYTLQGQRVEKPGKGIYIKNGKKVIIK